MDMSPTENIERLQRLALVCELDRLRLRLALRPAPASEITIAGLPATAVTKVLSYIQFLPGRIGQLARGLALGSTFLRLIKPLVRSVR
jgi:hypothetical protein